ncbi:MAG: hypothetical protein M1828_005584 [Chrysothrix sp. TS-e1954]|nr:MAG: hypothetical protein M1828_005584 [Chrysothrix sp. TS-e1954]
MALSSAGETPDVISYPPNTEVYGTYAGQYTLCDGYARASGPFVPTRTTVQSAPSTGSNFNGIPRKCYTNDAAPTFPVTSPPCSIGPSDCATLWDSYYATIPPLMESLPPGTPACNLSQSGSTNTFFTQPRQQCTIYGQAVKLYYWPVTTTNGDLCLQNGVTLTTPGTRSAILGNGTTITSPSVFLSMDTIMANFLDPAGAVFTSKSTMDSDSGYCLNKDLADHQATGGASGTSYYNVGITLAPQSLSSVVSTFQGYENDPEKEMSLIISRWYGQSSPATSSEQMVTAGIRAEPFNFANLNGPVPASAYILGLGAFVDPNLAIQDIVTSPIILDNYNPQLAVPAQVRDLDPRFQDCDIDLGGAYDPPRTMSAVAAVAGITAPTKPTSTPASPHSAIATPPARTSQSPVSTSDDPTASSKPVDVNSHSDDPENGSMSVDPATGVHSVDPIATPSDANTPLLGSATNDPDPQNTPLAPATKPTGVDPQLGDPSPSVKGAPANGGGVSGEDAITQTSIGAVGDPVRSSNTVSRPKDATEGQSNPTKTQQNAPGTPGQAPSDDISPGSLPGSNSPDHPADSASDTSLSNAPSDTQPASVSVAVVTIGSKVVTAQALADSSSSLPNKPSSDVQDNTHAGPASPGITAVSVDGHVLSPSMIATINGEQISMQTESDATALVVGTGSDKSTAALIMTGIPGSVSSTIVSTSAHPGTSTTASIVPVSAVIEKNPSMPDGGSDNVLVESSITLTPGGIATISLSDGQLRTVSYDPAVSSDGSGRIVEMASKTTMTVPIASLDNAPYISAAVLSDQTDIIMGGTVTLTPGSGTTVTRADGAVETVSYVAGGGDGGPAETLVIDATKTSTIPVTAIAGTRKGEASASAVYTGKAVPRAVISIADLLFFIAVIALII